MTTYVGLLRAVNVGGTGKLPMTELRAMCEAAGFTGVRTYIQSGNVVFHSPLAEPEIRTRLEQALLLKMGKPIDVLVRTAAELRALLAANPFPTANPSQVGILFLSKPPSKKIVGEIAIPGREEIRVMGREAFVHYPDGMGRSKLKFMALGIGTIRNVNTVTKLAALAAE